MNQLISKGIITSIRDFREYLNSFFDFLNRKSNTIDTLKLHSNDEIAQMAKEVEKNIIVIKDTIFQDRELLDEAKVVMSRASNGWFSQTITKSTQNNSLMELKANINNMLENMKSRFLYINSQLEQYASHNYLNELKIDNIERNGVFDKFQINMNILRESITNMLIENKQNGLTLDKSSDILLENVDILNSNSNKAAASLEETAAALEEITSNISSNTQNIVKMSGFAVVAQEVRNLASRSAEAASEIKSLVENATTKANDGKNIANKMIDGYNNLNEDITKTINLISSIEISSKEQLSGITQINDAVNSLDQQTQQNASIASKTHEVAVQTDVIAKLVVRNANEKEFIGKDDIKAKDI